MGEANRVLIVDDEALVGDVLGYFLADHGFETLVVRTARQALQEGERFQPHLLISDYLLEHGASGAQVAQALQAHNHDLRVLLLSGLPADDVRAKAASIDHLHVRMKPLELDQVLDLARSLCG